MSKLGNYEMVTSLSEKTIKGNFETMFALGQIHDVWSCRLILDDFGEVTGAVIDEGHHGDDDNPSYDQVSTQFNDAFAHPLADTSMQGFVAQIESPYISTRNELFRSVNFHIPFAEGRLSESNLGGSKIRTWDLKGVVYVFVVDLSRIHYSDVADISDPVAAANLAQYVSDARKNTPLEAEDFTAEKLFLNFETATFIADSAETQCPPSWSEADKGVLRKFKDLLQNYFVGPGSSFKGSEHPYVLGYGVKVPHLAERAAAVFQPTELDFSTSFVPASGPADASGHVGSDCKKSSLNYLMTVKNAPEKNSATGAMSSLLTDGNDLLAIDYELFFGSYLILVFDQIVAQLNHTVVDLNRSEKDSGRGFDVIQVSGEKTIDATGTFAVERDAHDELRVHFGTAVVNVRSYTEKTTIGGGGMSPTVSVEKSDYRKKITARPTADITFPKDEKSKSSILRIVVTFVEETEYCYGKTVKATTIQDSTGLHIDLYPGGKGDMLVRIEPFGESVQPRLITGEPKAVSVVNAAISGTFYAQLRFSAFLSELKARLEAGLRTLPKVVLPISNVYSYKSVGYIKHGVDETKSVITFETTYQPQGPEV